MNWFESFLYGLVAGFAEFVPVSSQAHQTILRYLFGETVEHTFMRIAIRLGILSALLFTSRSLLLRLKKASQLSKIPKRRRKRQPDPQAMADISFIKTACVPLLLGFFAYTYTAQWNEQLQWIALFLGVNGLLLLLPSFLPKGNKDARNMSMLDATLFGTGSILSMLPGISCVGMTSSIAIARGANTQQAYKWSLLLSIPASIGFLCFDAYWMFTLDQPELTFILFLKCVVAGIAGCFGALTAINFAKFLSVKAGLSNFCYYAWGAGLFAFILFLT